jgi:plasmid maintenance system killer protein
MIVSYRDRRTERFARGDAVKKFPDLRDRLKFASTGSMQRHRCATPEHFPGIAWRR